MAVALPVQVAEVVAACPLPELLALVVAGLAASVALRQRQAPPTLAAAAAVQEAAQQRQAVLVL